MARGHTRVGAAAAKRRKAGGKLAVGRESATKAEMQLVRDAVRRRARDRDEIAPELLGTDLAHIVSRGRGGADVPWNLLWLSRVLHRAQDKAYRVGRLVYVLGPDIEWWWRGNAQLAPGSVRWAIEVRADKWSPVTAILGEGLIDLRLPTPGEGADAARSESPAQDSHDPRGVRP